MWINLSKEVLQHLAAGKTLCLGEADELRDMARQALAEETDPVHMRYRQLAESQAEDGEIEVDDGAVVSPGDDPGAYVMAWLWVPEQKPSRDEVEVDTSSFVIPFMVWTSRDTKETYFDAEDWFKLAPAKDIIALELNNPNTPYEVVKWMRQHDEDVACFFDKFEQQRKKQPELLVHYSVDWVKLGNWLDQNRPEVYKDEETGS